MESVSTILKTRHIYPFGRGTQRYLSLLSRAAELQFQVFFVNLMPSGRASEVAKQHATTRGHDMGIK